MTLLNGKDLGTVSYSTGINGPDSETAGDSSRLQKRVAELEGVIREVGTVLPVAAGQIDTTPRLFTDEEQATPTMGSNCCGRRRRAWKTRSQAKLRSLIVPLPLRGGRVFRCPPSPARSLIVIISIVCIIVLGFIRPQYSAVSGEPITSVANASR